MGKDKAALKDAVKDRDARIVALEVQLAEAVASSGVGEGKEELWDQLQEQTKRADELEEQITQTEDAKNNEIDRLEDKLADEVARLEQALREADERRDAEVGRLEDELDIARSAPTPEVTPGQAPSAALAAKIEQKNKKLRFVAEQLEDRDAQVVELQTTAASLETELAGLRKILARKKAAVPAPAPAPSGTDLSTLAPELEALKQAAAKLDEHLSMGVDEWQELEMNIGGAVSLLIRETSKDRALQRIVNPILEELQAGLERGRHIVKGGHDLVASERETLSNLTEAIDKD